MGSLVRHWSTDSVAESQRLAYWMDSICDSFLEMKSRPVKSAGLSGSIRQSAVGAIVVNEVRGTPQVVNRDQRAIGKSDANYFYLITQLGSPWCVQHAGHHVLAKPGDSVLVDSRQAYEFGFAGELHNLSIQMPIAWVQRWLPEPQAVLGRAIDGSQGWGAALRTFKQALTPEFASDSGFPAELLSDQLGALMALAMGTVPACTPSQRGPYQRCIKALRERISSTHLVAQEVATHSAVSLRSLHRAFAAHGETFAGVLRDMRLAEAKRMLADPRFRTLTVAEVAQRCGYADVSHFARQFRLSAGQAPGAFRTRVVR